MSDGADRPRREDPGYRGDIDYSAPVSYGVGPPAPKDDLALTALVIGIVALAFGVVGLGLLASPVAVVLGLVSMRRIDRSEGRRTGRGQAKAGGWALHSSFGTSGAPPAGSSVAGSAA